MKDMIFASAVARFNEKKLLKREQFLRLTSAADFHEAVKMLYDYGYIRVQSDSIDALINAQTDALNRYAAEECPHPRLQEILLNPFVFNNAKLYYKSVLTGREADNDGRFEIDDTDMREAVMSGDYSALSPALRDCLTRLDALRLAGNLNGRMVDIQMECAMYAASLSCARKSFRPELVRFVRAKIDLNNLSTFIRCRALGKPWEFCAEMLVEGGKINVADLAAGYSESDKDVAERLEDCPFYEVFAAALDGKINIDLGIETALIKVVAIKETDYASLSPFLTYYYKQAVEHKVVKMVLTMLKNNLRADMEKRLKGIYD